MTTTAETTSFECVECGYVGHFDGAYTDPLDRGQICGECLEHLNGNTWTEDNRLIRMTKDDLIEHYDQHHGTCYITARTTRRGLMASHQNSHRRAWERKQRLIERAGTIDCLRSTFGCRVTDDSFGSANDEWVADHVRNHETGNDLGGRLL